MTSAQLLKEIAQLSQTMWEHATAGEWEPLGQLESRRQQRIDACFPLDDSIQSPEAAGEQIKAVLELDRQVMVLARQQQQQLGESLDKINKGRHATKAYRNNAKGA